MLSSGDGGIFASAPVLKSDGSLEVSVSPSRNGRTVWNVTMIDDGGSEGRDRDTSDVLQLDLRVQPLNDAPSFDLVPMVSTYEDAVDVVMPHIATNISLGPADEAGQRLTFSLRLISGDGSIFATAPALNASGALRFS